MSNTLERRILEHKAKESPNSFTAKYNIDKLVYYDVFPNAKDAIFAEKKIKGWKREKKIKLIEEKNPRWIDLFKV